MKHYNFDKIQSDELINLFNGNEFEDDEAYLHDIACKISGSGAGGISFLLGILHTGDDVRRRAAIFGISGSKMNRKEIITAISSCLYDNHPLTVSEAIDGLITINDFSGWEEIKSLTNHPSEYVRGAVLRYARHALDKKESFGFLVNGLKDSHPIVIENAIDELADLEKPEAIPYIEKFLEHPDSDVRLAAETAIKDLAV